MAKQHGNSGHGPEELDRAVQNRALGIDEDVDISDRNEGSQSAAPLASGEPAESYQAGGSEHEPVLAEGEDVGIWSADEAGEGGSRGEQGLNASSDQPGGGTASESERPDSAESRWGSNREG
jgi:hypothetical protein